MTRTQPAVALAATEVMPAAKPLSATRMPQLDGIRGMAILLVLIWHYAIIKWAPGSNALFDPVAQSLSLTWSGVDLFFVLSGFLIGGILLDHRNAPHYFKAFYARRVSRIFPLYFAWLAIFALLVAIPFWTASDSMRALLGNPLPLWAYATFTQNFAMVAYNTYGPEWLGITWSLAIEEQFYALIPLIIRLVPPKRLPFLLFLYIVLAPLLRLLLVFIPDYNSLLNHTLMPPRADGLLLGVLCAYLVRQPRASEFLRNHRPHLYVAFVILLVGTGVLAWNFNSPRYLVMATAGYSWLALLYTAFLLIAVVETRGPIAWLTHNRYLRSLGLLAYGVYLIHQAVNILVHTLILGRFPQLQTLPDVLVTLLALCLTLLIAQLSYTYFEKPILDWGHGFQYSENPVARTAHLC